MDWLTFRCPLLRRSPYRIGGRINIDKSAIYGFGGCTNINKSAIYIPLWMVVGLRCCHARYQISSHLLFRPCLCRLEPDAVCEWRGPGRSQPTHRRLQLIIVRLCLRDVTFISSHLDDVSRKTVCLLLDGIIASATGCTYDVVVRAVFQTFRVFATCCV